MEKFESSPSKERTVSSTSSSSSGAEFVNQAFDVPEVELSKIDNDSKNKHGLENSAAGQSIVNVGGPQQSNDMQDVSKFQDSLGNSNEFITPGFRKMYIAAVVVLQYAICMGITASYSATATTDMKKPHSSIHPTKDEMTWIGSLMTVGALFGGTAGGYFSNKLGRKGTLIWNSLPYVTGWLCIAYASKIGLIYIGRILSGFSTGIVSVATPMYLVEISTPDKRGLLGAGFQLFVVIGVLIVNCLGSALTWRYVAIAGGVMCLISSVLMLLMPESPRWLMTRKRRKEAKKALIFLQGELYDAEGECEALENEMKEQPSGGIQLKELLVPTVFKPFLLSISLMFFQQFSAINAILFYTDDIFTSAHVPLKPTTATIIVASVQVVATFLASTLMDRAGRKPLLLLSGAGMALSLYAFGGYALSVSNDKTLTDRLGWLPVVCLTAYISAFSVGFGPAPWLMVAEMTPARYRSIVSGVATALNWTFAFFVTKSYSFLTQNIKDYGSYAFYGTICALSMLVTIFFLPETKGKKMNEIEEFFKRK